MEYFESFKSDEISFVAPFRSSFKLDESDACGKGMAVSKKSGLTTLVVR